MKHCQDCKKSIQQRSTRCRSCNAISKWKSNGFFTVIPNEVRFWKFVKKSKDCWIWVGGKFKGYGRFTKTSPRKNVLSHRYAYELKYGLIPKGKFAGHRCDNPSCVNPEHIFIGNSADNSRDASIKGRTCCKLTTEQIKYVRSHYTGKYGEQTALARKFHVRQGTIWNYINFKSRPHLPS